MGIPAKFKGDRNLYKDYLRRLKNFKGWDDERLDAYIDSKIGEPDDDSVDRNDPRKISNLEAALHPALQSYFRSEVKKLLDEVTKIGGSREIMRPLAEETIFYGILLRQKLVASSGLKGDLDERGLKELIEARVSLLDKLGVTPKEQRLAGRKSDDSLAALLQKSSDAAERVRERKSAAEQKAEEMLGTKPLPVPDPDVKEDDGETVVA